MPSIGSLYLSLPPVFTYSRQENQLSQAINSRSISRCIESSEYLFYFQAHYQLQQEQFKCKQLKPDERNELRGLLQVPLVLGQHAPLFKPRFFEKRNSRNSRDEQVDDAGRKDREVLRAAEAWRR